MSQTLANIMPFSLSPDTTYYVAPTVYWTMIEASLCIIAVCLPSLRPIFKGVSPENLLNSLRSVLSLHSFNSRPSTYRDSSFDEQNRKESGASEFAMLEQPYQGSNQYETTAVKGPVKVEEDDLPERGIVVRPRNAASPIDTIELVC